MDSHLVAPPSADQVAEQAIGYLTGALVAACCHLGDRLGLYRAMHGAGPQTSEELAERTGLDERWVREWLHGQASAGLVRSAGVGRFELTAGQAAVLADETDPAFLAGGFALALPLLQRLDAVEASFRTGRGTPYDGLGEAHAVGEARFSGPWMRASLVSTILPALDGVVDALARGGRVADVGCGSGGALLEMARAFPRSEFHGYDSARVAIDLAERLVRAARLPNITLHHAAAADLPADAAFDFVLTWDCLHDMTDPAAAFRAIHDALRPDGAWLIVDIAGAATPEETHSLPLAPLLYAFSLLDCLGCSTSTHDGAALGTLGLPEPLVRRFAADAGFTRVIVHDFGNPVNAFYEVRR